MVKVLVPLFQGFEEIEALSIIDLLRRGGIEVITASISSHKLVEAGHGVKVEADILFSTVATDMSFNAIIVPGGPGHKRIGECTPLMNLLTQYHKTAGKLVSAICAAPVYLGKCGILEGKRATCYPGMMSQLTCGTPCNDEVVVDGDVITSRGPGTAFAFGLALIEKLVGKAKRDEVCQGAVYMH
ncbi:putative DJ-1/PfpI family protein [Monocercomonoides exilis]|uniref:putative DJ-1/PfpI family protein n=1 Tax=Monocercomonoides exilis TaxID=2049356 RepID=UPI00355AB37C|nr:putative DJ-1/PfpI family protein [Monocercomonoides exilis]|eukprot:MONOS_2919.1-p1 / transcript=MONOS_2919.1 / gene=MONOS_2919 / organism=Monocercomonoides_exilis_PA203 / gene_product=4-methyl-5 / transcript_product=4-methyl-5 / location=Mono_scaffold00064:11215-11889(+) / protein_length=184 / sequence_SO=supercontig / SO=protein_coding / is_pseudo=false